MRYSISFYFLYKPFYVYSQFLQPGAKLVEWGPKEKL